MPATAFVRNAERFIRLGLVAAGCTGAVAGGHYVYTIYKQEAHPKDEGLVQIAAITLSSSIVRQTISDPEIHRELATFGLKVLTHPGTVSELKRFFIHEFTADTPTRANLKHFVVNEVVRDRWVHEELLDLVREIVADAKADADIYPSGVLGWLGVSALAALKSQAFKEAAKQHALMATWDAFMCPPPPGTRFV